MSESGERTIQVAVTGEEQQGPDRPEATGLIAGRYRVQRRIGKGGMGEVMAARDEQIGVIACGFRGLLRQRRKIIVEDENALVLRVARAPGAHVAGAKIAIRVVSCGLRLLRPLHLPLPGSVRAMRRNQHPLARERIQAAVRGVL